MVQVLLRYKTQRLKRTVQRWGWHAVVAVATLAYSLQYVELCRHSELLYHHFELTYDFALYAQAYHAISMHNLDPSLSIAGYPFLRNHFELGFIPISLLGHLLGSSSFFILGVQDLAMVAAEVVVMWFAVSFAKRHFTLLSFETLALGLVVIAGTLANPWIYGATTFDVHLEVLGVVFALLVPYFLYHSYRVLALLSAVMALSFGAVLATYLIAASLGFYVSRTFSITPRRVRYVVIVGGVSLVWLVVAMGLHFENSTYQGGYGYLVSPNSPVPHPTLTQIILGAISHPDALVGAIRANSGYLAQYLLSGGVIGVLDPLGVIPFLGVMLPPLVNSSPIFIQPASVFQVIGGILFLVVGTVGVVGLGLRSTHKGRRLLALSFSICYFLFACFDLRSWYPKLISPWMDVTGAQVEALDEALAAIPKGAALIASQGVVGRFADRSHLVAYLVPGVYSSPQKELFVLITPSVGRETVPIAASTRALHSLSLDNNAQLLLEKAGVYLYRVEFPTSSHQIRLAQLSTKSPDNCHFGPVSGALAIRKCW